MRQVIYHYLNGSVVVFDDIDYDGPTRHVSESEAYGGYGIGEEWYEEEAP